MPEIDDCVGKTQSRVVVISNLDRRVDTMVLFFTSLVPSVPLTTRQSRLLLLVVGKKGKNSKKIFGRVTVCLPSVLSGVATYLEDGF